MKSKILNRLRGAEEFVSGQQLCEEFGVSRTAVWKAINQLKEEGYEIEAVHNKGYRLLGCPDIISAEEVKSRLHTDWAGCEVKYFDTLDSTNICAKRMAEEGAPNGTLVIADEQTAGRGRCGEPGDAERHGDRHDTSDASESPPGKSKYADSGDGYGSNKGSQRTLQSELPDQVAK